jgi:hypothetical protein
MNKTVKLLAILAVCFTALGLHAVPTMLKCTNPSNNVDMNLIIEGTVTTIPRGKTVSDIRISTSTSYIRIMPSNASGVPITIQKSALMPVDEKYDMKIEIQSTSDKKIKVEIFSNNKSLGIWAFTVGV